MVPFAKNDEEQGFVLIFFFKIEPRLLAIVNFLLRFQFFLIFMKSITMTSTYQCILALPTWTAGRMQQ